MGSKARIILFNHTSKLVCHPKYILELRDLMKLRAPGYFWSPQYRKRQWDGYIRYITEAGSFSTGLLGQLCTHLRELKISFEIEDKRKLFRGEHKLDELGGLEFFGYQLDAITATLDHKLEGVKFPRGILNEATNAGKTLIAGGIFAAYKGKRIGLFLVNNKELFDQSVVDFEKLLPGEIGFINSDKIKLNRINICMVQTLSNRIKSDPKIKALVQKTDIIVVDEVDDMVGRKDCKLVLTTAYEAVVRLGLTGTAAMHKEKTRNQLLVSYFGPIIHAITNKELVDQGISTKPDIRIKTGNIKLEADTYEEEYMKAIVRNTSRHNRIWDLVTKFDAKNRGPFLILFRLHEHGRRLLESCPEELRKFYKVAMVHHKTSNRKQIFKDFNNGKIHILISSFIIKRGKNLPLIKTLINAAGGDSQANVLQIFGRLLRSHKTKKKGYMIDFYDYGKYMRRHSKHRIIYYKNQKFEVKEQYKKTNPKRAIK